MGKSRASNTEDGHGSGLMSFLRFDVELRTKATAGGRGGRPPLLLSLVGS